MDNGRILYTVDEAGHALRLSRAMVNKLLARGDLVGVKIGTARRIPATELVAYVERLRAAERGAEKAEEVANVA